METAQRSALVVGADADLFERLGTLLRVTRFFADYAETGESALESIAALPFDAIVVAYPLRDILVPVFLDAVRAADSPCRRSAVVLLAPADLQGEAEALVGRGANRVVTLDDHIDQLPHVLLRLFEVSPRYPVRAVSRVTVQSGLVTRLTLCQTENLSTSGMLIRTDPSLPIGTQLSFALALPGERKPVCGSAVVVRRTTPQREKVSGVGVRIASFDDDGKARYEARLASFGS